MMKLVLAFVSLMLYAGVTTETSDLGSIYYDDLPITAEPGTSVEFGCVFSHVPAMIPTTVILRKCKPGKFCVNDQNNTVFSSTDANATTAEFRGRVSLMVPDLGKNKNCSIRIDDASISMTGRYVIGIRGINNVTGNVAVLNTPIEKPIKVTGLRQPKVTGETIVGEGEDLNLTCDGQSEPPAVVSWSFNDIILLSAIQTSTLTIRKVTPENAGEYICVAEHLLNVTKTTSVHVFVISHPVKKEFMPGMLALSIVVFLFVVVTLAACFFRCRKSSSDQDENMEMIIPQEQQGGVHGHEQNIQEGDAPHSEDENV